MKRSYDTALELPGQAAEYKAFREKYGARFHVIRDEAGEPIIPCWKRRTQFPPGALRPHIYQYGNGQLGYVGAGRVKKGTLLRMFPGVFKVELGGQGEFILTFAEDHLASVAPALGAWRRRRLSEGERERLREVGRALQRRLKASKKGRVRPKKGTKRAR